MWRFVAARILGLWVRIPLGAWMSLRRVDHPSRGVLPSCYIFDLHPTVKRKWEIFGLCHYSVQWETCIRFDEVTFRKMKKVKRTVEQALRLCTGRTGPRGSRGIALLFLNRGTRVGWGVSLTPRPHFTPGKDPVPIVQRAGWAPGPVWTGAENLVSTGIFLFQYGFIQCSNTYTLVM